MWASAPSPYVHGSRVRYAEPRNDRQPRRRSTLDGMPPRPWRSYSTENLEYGNAPLPPRPPPMPAARPLGRRVTIRPPGRPRHQRRERPVRDESTVVPAAPPPVVYYSSRPPPPEPEARTGTAVYADVSSYPATVEARIQQAEELPLTESPVEAADRDFWAVTEAPLRRMMRVSRPPAGASGEGGEHGDEDDEDEDDDVDDDGGQTKRPDSPLAPPALAGDDDDDVGYGHIGSDASVQSDRSAPAPERATTPMGDDDDLDALDGFDLFPQRVPSLQDGSSRTDTDLATLLDSAAGAADTESSGDGLSGSSATRAFASTYTGDAEVGGEHKATLTVVHDPQRRTRPLYHWLHIQQDVMDLEEFWAEIPRQVRLSEVEMAATAKLRADVKRHSVKSRQNSRGNHVGYVYTHYFQVALDDVAAAGKKKKASSSSQLSAFPKPSQSAAATSTAPAVGVSAARWICLPYFSLERCAGLLSASGLSSFPPLTLLQSHYSRTPPQRDLGQAVCELGTAPRGHCFHVAQLWCLVLDNS